MGRGPAALRNSLRINDLAHTQSRHVKKRRKVLHPPKNALHYSCRKDKQITERPNMKDQLDATDKLYVASRILLGQEAIAEFNYEDKFGYVTHRRVKVDSVTTDKHGNFIWYSYSDGGGHGGGHRAFNAERINGFRFVRK
jgi:hypothetical protein